MWCGIVGFKQFVSDPYRIFKKNGKVIYGISYLMIFFLLVIFILQRVNFDYMDELQKKVKNMEEHKYIIDRLENSIIIIDDHQIEFVNTKFLN